MHLLDARPAAATGRSRARTRAPTDQTNPRVAGARRHRKASALLFQVSRSTTTKKHRFALHGVEHASDEGGSITAAHSRCPLCPCPCQHNGPSVCVTCEIGEDGNSKLQTAACKSAALGAHVCRFDREREREREILNSNRPSSPLSS